MAVKFNQSDLESLAGEILSLSREMRQDTFYSLIVLAEITNKFLMVKSKVGEGHFTRVSVLNALVLNDGCLTPTMLSKKVYRTKYAISRVIDKLEKDGLVEIEQQSSSSDKRFKKVFITQKGIEFLRTRMPERRRLAKEATSFLNSEEMYSLGKLSRKLRKHLLEKISSENSSE